jgi:hypothetical protein
MVVETALTLSIAYSAPARAWWLRRPDRQVEALQGALGQGGHV